MKKIVYFIFMILTVSLSAGHAQTKRACDITDVGTLNKILNTAFTYDPNSIINKDGKFECRYTDPKTPGKYISIGLLQAKIEYGYDILKTEFETNQKSVTAGKKVDGKFVHFSAYPKGGSTAYYMTAPKDNFSGEAVLFKFRKDNFIINFSAEGVETNKVVEKLDDLYKTLSSKAP